MQVFNTICELQETLVEIRKQAKTIGFVPTMGALHEGHLSLVNSSKSQTAITVASIFVNPTQFNNKSDLEKYPRTLNCDLQMLQKAKCDIVFVPNEKEIYPEPDARIFDFGLLDKVMEGKYRTGHFNGVAQVVSKLFDIVKPEKAYFGEKDFQQLTIIKLLVKQMGIKTEIIGCPIIREADGLAMSSRNVRLNDEQRKAAATISQTLFEAQKLAPKLSVHDLIKFVIEKINLNAHLEVEYFEVVDNEMLQPITRWTEDKIKVGCIAVFVGDIRLIDNIKFNV